MRVRHGPHKVEHAALRRAARDKALPFAPNWRQLKDAPNWKQLKDAREAAAQQKS